MSLDLGFKARGTCSWFSRLRIRVRTDGVGIGGAWEGCLFAAGADGGVRCYL